MPSHQSHFYRKKFSRQDSSILEQLSCRHNKEQTKSKQGIFRSSFWRSELQDSCRPSSQSDGVWRTCRQEDSSEPKNHHYADMHEKSRRNACSRKGRKKSEHDEFSPLQFVYRDLQNSSDWQKSESQYGKLSPIGNHEIRRPDRHRRRNLCDKLGDFNNAVVSQCMNDEELARFRTQICPNKAAGDCRLEERCSFSHCLSFHRRPPHLTGYRPTLCPNVIFSIGNDRKMRVKNYCKRGRLCLFSHTKEEQMYHPKIYKTLHCRDWPGCTKHFCPFAHGQEELRNPDLIEFDLVAGPEKPEPETVLRKQWSGRNDKQTRQRRTPPKNWCDAEKRLNDDRHHRREDSVADNQVLSHAIASDEDYYRMLRYPSSSSLSTTSMDKQALWSVPHTEAHITHSEAMHDNLLISDAEYNNLFQSLSPNKECLYQVSDGSTMSITTSMVPNQALSSATPSTIGTDCNELAQLESVEFSDAAKCFGSAGAERAEMEPRNAPTDIRDMIILELLMSATQNYTDTGLIKTNEAFGQKQAVEFPGSVLESPVHEQQDSCNMPDYMHDQQTYYWQQQSSEGDSLNYYYNMMGMDDDGLDCIPPFPLDRNQNFTDVPDSLGCSIMNSVPTFPQRVPNDQDEQLIGSIDEDEKYSSQSPWPRLLASMSTVTLVTSCSSNESLSPENY